MAKDTKFTEISHKTFADIKRKNERKARDYINNPLKAQKLIDDALKKAQSFQGILGELFTKVILLISIVSDYISGAYKLIPVGSIVLIVVGIIYFVSPIDLVPDIILGIGYVDDAAVLAIVFTQVNADLETYAEWKKRNWV